MKTKAWGFNMIRKHVKVEPARWYYHCDKEGMLVWFLLFKRIRMMPLASRSADILRKAVYDFTSSTFLPFFDKLTFIEALLYDIVKTKAWGFNMIRKHVKVEPARWYYHCDKEGML